MSETLDQIQDENEQKENKAQVLESNLRHDLTSNMKDTASELQ